MSPLPVTLLAADMEWAEFRWIVYGLAGLVIVFYVGMPLLVLTQQKFEARPKMIRFDVDDFDWPAEIDQLFTEAVDDLAESGFEVVDGLFLPSAVQNVKTALILLVNRTEKDAAMVTAMYAQPVSSGSLKTLYVEFSTQFDDGLVYDTNNSSQMSAFPQRADTELHQFVRVKDATTLYQIHQAILERDGRSRSQKVMRFDRDFGGDAVAFLQNAMAEEFDDAADIGYLKRVEGGNNFAPTLKGAFLMVWKELWPWKLIRQMQRNQKAQSLLADLNRTGIGIEA